MIIKICWHNDQHFLIFLGDSTISPTTAVTVIMPVNAIMTSYVMA